MLLSLVSSSSLVTMVADRMRSSRIASLRAVTFEIPYLLMGDE